MVKPAYENGHFYSPVVNTDEATKDSARIWGRPLSLHGIDLNRQLQDELLKTWFPRLIDGYDYPATGAADDRLERFYESNGMFENVDPRALFCLLRMIRPKRIIEVGSGYSTLLMMDINDRFLGGSMQITSIEPYPRSFLSRASESGRIKLLTYRLQDVSARSFEQLEDGDILFIDSSHVSKTGSDVNRLLLEIIPTLKDGVYVHLHDIFLPDDYPKQWVIDDGRSWNEQYLLQAFLAFNRNFRVIFGAWYASHEFPDAISNLVGQRRPVGGSFWIRRKNSWPLKSGWTRLISWLRGKPHFRP